VARHDLCAPTPSGKVARTRLDTGRVSFRLEHLESDRVERLERQHELESLG
jgi:hypothetical protein